MAEETEPGQLSETRNERIFRTEILPDYLPDELVRADHPTLIVLGGQPGSGTTALLTANHTELERSGSVIRIVADDLRSYHPGYDTHQATDAETASRFTQVDADTWAHKLLAAATKRRAHVVFATTMQSPENVERTMTTGRDANYRIEAHVLAVNPRVSWQGCHYRFEEVSHVGAVAGIPPRSVHDRAATGLAESLERIERGRLADRVVLQTAAGEKIYDNALEHGQWRFATIARQVLEETRSRPLTRTEIDRFAEVWEKVVSRMQERRAPTDRIDEVRNQSRDDVAVFLAERRNADAADNGQGKREIGHWIDRGHGPDIAVHAADAFVNAGGHSDRQKAGDGRGQNVRPGDVLIPGRELPDLGEAEIDAKLRDSSRLVEKRAEIERLSQLVHGNAAALSTTVEGIDGPMAGSVAGQDVRAGKLGPMAGEGRGFLRAESPERQSARAHLPQLAAALEDYGRTVDFERHEIETRHREEQHRQRQEIRAPSPELSAVLHAPAHEQASRLHAAPDLRRELDGISASINRRLAPSDRVALKAGTAEQLARSLGVSNDRAAALARAHTQAQMLLRHVPVQRQQIDQKSSLIIAR